MRDRIRRHPERASTDRGRLFALLDEVHWGVLCIVADGLPWAVPMLHARNGDRLILHGSTRAGVLNHDGGRAEVVYTVVAFDALVVGATTFNTSANYRSATIRGTLAPVSDADKAAAVDAFSDTLLPGRVAEVRPSTPTELHVTSVLELPIVDGSWLYKSREGQASNPEGDAEARAWAGVIPLLTSWGDPTPAEWVHAQVPPSVQRLTGRRSGSPTVD